MRVRPEAAAEGAVDSLGSGTYNRGFVAAGSGGDAEGSWELR